MFEHIVRALYYLHVHLLFASMVWLAAWVLTSVRGGSATTKYWIWVATSLNFIIPLGAVLDAVWASHLSWAAPLNIIGGAVNDVSRNVPAAVALSDESVIQRDRGGDLVSALAKLANPEREVILQARASSFLTHRLSRLLSAQPERTGGAASALLTAVFGAVLLMGIFETVAHTACCFIAKT